MSIKATNWAYFHVKVGRKLKPTLLALADAADDNGIAFPSLEYIRVKIEAEATKTVARHIKKLLELGVIERARRSGGYRNTTNVYRLKLDQAFDVTGSEAAGQGEAPEGNSSGDKLSLLNESSRDTQESLLSGDKMSLLDSRVGTQPCPVSRDTAMSPELLRTVNNNNNGDRQGSDHHTAQPGHNAFRPGSTVKPFARYPLPLDWQPAEHTLERIRYLAIDSAYAKTQLEAFRLHFANGAVQHEGGWESKFLQWVQRGWQNGGRERFHQAANTATPITDRLTDRSWAESSGG